MCMSCMLHIFLQYRDHYTSNITGAYEVRDQCCTLYMYIGGQIVTWWNVSLATAYTRRLCALGPHFIHI